MERKPRRLLAESANAPPDATPHVPMKFKSQHPSIEGLAMRTSTRWFSVRDSKRAFTPIPYVTVSGKFSVNTLCYWTAYPQQILATMSATVCSRLKRIMSRRFSMRYAKTILPLLARISFLYTVTRSDYLLDRFLGMLRKKDNRGPATRFLYFSTCNLGEDDRFVYNQLCNTSLWLTFRCTTCKRDKPISVSDSKDPLAWFTRAGESVRDDYLRFRASSLLWKPPKPISSKFGEAHAPRPRSWCSVSSSDLSEYP